MRTYSATTVAHSSSLFIDLENATFGGDGSYFWHTVYANFVEDVAHLYFQDPPIWEQLTADQQVVIYGTEAVGTTRDLPVTMSFPAVSRSARRLSRTATRNARCRRSCVSRTTTSSPSVVNSYFADTNSHSLANLPRRTSVKRL
jgi:hypothetical protein